MAAPKLMAPTSKCENCEYNVFLFASKDCYMCRGASYMERCFYCYTSAKNTDCSDLSFSMNCELGYECIDCDHMYNCNHCQKSHSCTDCEHCYDCRNCTNCFGCAGLRQKNYHIFNKPVSKDEYAMELKKAKSLPPDEIIRRIEELKRAIPHQALYGSGNEHVAGDFVNNSKNCYYAFNTDGSEDCAYTFDEIINCKDCVDITHTHNSELCYQTSSCDRGYNCNFVFWSESCTNCEYCYCLMNCSDCFMCTNLRGKKYHILNEPYEKDAYFKKITEIKEQLKNGGIYGQHLIYLALQDTPEVAQFFR